MSWVQAAEYKALIGGILYRNVPQPVVCDGKPLISLARNTESGHLAVSIEVVQQDRSAIASVVNNTVTLHNAAAEHIVFEASPKKFFGCGLSDMSSFRMCCITTRPLTV